jgi:hypothetical protein
MEQTAAALNGLCLRWLERRHARRRGRDAIHRLSFICTYHQDRNLAATRSRLRRYCQNEDAL